MNRLRSDIAVRVDTLAGKPPVAPIVGSAVRTKTGRVRPGRTHTASRRRGSAYVLVLGISMLVMVIGLSAIMVARVEARGAELSRDYAQARLYAHSAIEYGFQKVRDDSNWWNGVARASWLTDQPFGDGTISLDVIVAPDGNGQADGTDPAMLIATGIMGDARHMVQVEFMPVTGGYEIISGSWQQVTESAGGIVVETKGGGVVAIK